MSLTITDKQVATMRSLLAADIGQFQHSLDRLGPGEDIGALGTAAFWLLVERRFANRPEDDVIRFIGDVRSRSVGLAQKIDPIIAERLVKSVYNDDPVSDIDAATMRELMVLLVPALARDEHFTNEQLDEFLPQICKFAEEAFG